MFVSRAHHEEVIALLRNVVETQSTLLRKLKDDNERLLARYHELRVTGANVPEKLPDPPKSPYQQLGIKTRAALTDMGIGLHTTNRKAMEQVALSLHAEGWPDDQLAAHIRAGEGHARNGRR